MESYESILSRMKTKFQEEAGFSADDASDIGIRLKVLAGEIFSINSNIEWLKREMFPQTASGLQLDKHAEERGLKRKEAVKSEGKLKFSLEEASPNDIIIPEGTVCSTSGAESLRFITLKEAVISAGSLAVEVSAQSEKAGNESNTNANTITIMVTQVQGIDNVINLSAFTGGLDEESDEELRKRLIQNYKNVSNGTNAAFYQNFVLKYDEVNSANVVKLSRGAGTIDIYVSGKGETISSEVLEKIKNDIKAEKEINVDVKVLNAELKTINVYFSLQVEAGYDKQTVQDNCKKAIGDYFLSLGIGETVYLSGVSDAIYHTEGVKNYKINSSSQADIAMTSGQKAVCGTITITDM